MAPDSRPCAADDSTEVTLALPILPEKLETWRRFCQELDQGRRGQGEALRETLGVNAIHAYLFQTSGSPVALLRLESEDPESLLGRIWTSQRPYLRWLRRKLSEIHGLDFDQTGPEPRIRLMAQWSED